MKLKGILLLLLIILNISAFAVNSSKSIKEIDKMDVKELQEVKDRLELQNLVYTFSNLSDTKEIDKQVMLFTENASVQSFENGVAGNKYVGREEIGKAFKNYLAQFDVVFHMNGQQTVTIKGDTAEGINYCQVVLIKNENGKKIRTTRGVIYQDKYRKVNEKWYIEDRKSNFMWGATDEIK